MRKKVVSITSIIALVVFAVLYANTQSISKNVQAQKKAASPYILDGDIIFQSSASGKAIEIATNSKYSHCGIIFKENNKYMVWEAIQPVTKTELQTWLARGKHKTYAIKRLKNRDKLLTPQVIQSMKKVGKSFLGKPYDFQFLWSNEKIYCSELVWKIYKYGANIEVGTIQKIKDFNLNDSRIKADITSRWGENIPYNESVVSPESIFSSSALETVK